jgi:hypothetical protein
VLLAAGRCRVGNFVKPDVESNFLNSLAVRRVEALNVDAVAFPIVPARSFMYLPRICVSVVDLAD